MPFTGSQLAALLRLSFQRTGRWRGTLVAIKVVEHAPGADMVNQAENIKREALLSTSLSHPNVITTFKVSTMLASTAQALRSTSSADTDWSAPHVLRTPGSPQQPGSASEDGASSHRSYLDSATSLHDDGLCWDWARLCSGHAQETRPCRSIGTVVECACPRPPSVVLSSWSAWGLFAAGRA